MVEISDEAYACSKSFVFDKTQAKKGIKYSANMAKTPISSLVLQYRLRIIFGLVH